MRSARELRQKPESARRAGHNRRAGWAALYPACGFGRLVLSGRSAPPPGHQIDIGSRLEERIGRGFDAVHPRDGIEDDALLLAGVVVSDFVQADFAERELRTLLG